MGESKTNKEKKEKKKKKKDPCFTGGRTFQVGSVGRDIFFKYIFLFGGKMTPLKTLKFPKNLIFFEKNFGIKIFSYLHKNLDKFSLTLTLTLTLTNNG